ncbi:MAG: gamma-glutamyltransferase family protein [Burkholderiales bacterium]
MQDLGWDFPYPSRRMPVMARNVVATTQPLAAQAGLRMLLQGGSAADAAIATAIALTVVEPTMNGIGSDAFALAWDGNRLHGLNASGPSPAEWTPKRFSGRSDMPTEGWDAVTVPGAVSGWVALWKRFGKLRFASLFEPAIEYARQGFPISHVVSRQWQAQLPRVKDQPGFAQAFLRDGRAPRAGEMLQFPEHARTLESIALTEGESFYRGALAEKIASFAKQCGGAMTTHDLAAFHPEWVAPLGQQYRHCQAHEIPPNGQGIAALMALGILEHFDLRTPSPDSAEVLHLQIEAMKLAFVDVYRFVADPGRMSHSPQNLLDPDYLKSRAALIRKDSVTSARHGTPSASGTVYLTAADAAGNMVSYIQSNYTGFGSGVVVPETGIALQNRGAGFSLEPGHPNEVAGGKRPFHTIIPGFLTHDAQALMSFGVMGGDMQPQGHVQMVSRVIDGGQNPQAAADAPRWKITKDGRLLVEAAFSGHTARQLEDWGHRVMRAEPDSTEFGAAQMILQRDGYYLAASEPRRDGQAVGF